MDYTIDYQYIYKIAIEYSTGSLKNIGNMYEYIPCELVVEPRNLEGAISDRSEALGYYIGNQHTISKLLLDQLLEIEQYGFVTINKLRHPCHNSALYRIMQSVAENKRDQWRPLNRNPLFKGRNIFHIHHDLFNGIGYNMENHFKRKYGRDGNDKQFFRFKAEIDSIITLLNKEPSKMTVNEVLSPFFAGVINEICISSKLTGEWLIFEVLDNHINFLCLALHEEGDKAIFEKIIPYLISGK